MARKNNTGEELSAVSGRRRCKDLGSHIGIAADSNRLGYYVELEKGIKPCAMYIESKVWLHSHR